MKAGLLALLLAACATTPPPPPNERVAGCWIARNAAETTTMRWLPDHAGTGVFRGDLLVYAPNADPRGTTYSLATLNQSWTLCDNSVSGAPTCWGVAEGREGPLGHGLAFIDQHRERLRIAVLDPAGERVIFDGQRDGCD